MPSHQAQVSRVTHPSGLPILTILAAVVRRILKGITLSNSQYILPGCIIEVSSHAIYNDSINWPDSDKFDGFCHYRLRRGDTAADIARERFATSRIRTQRSDTDDMLDPVASSQ